MPRYMVNATVSFSAWTYVDAESPEQARNEADDIAAGDFEYDPGTGEVEFNVTPTVEPDPFA